MSRTPGERPKYRGVADDLRKRAGAGEFDAKRKLPSERKLAERYGVHPMTIRQALGVLRDEGLLESRVGSGWHLAEWRPIVRNALKRLYPEDWSAVSSMWDVDIEGRRFDVVDATVDFPEAPDDVARVLDADAGLRVWRRNRKYLVDSQPVMRSTSYIPDEFAQGTRITEIDTGAGGIYERLREAGHGPVDYTEQVRGRLATPDEVDDLSLPAGAPVIELHRTAMEASGRVVEFNRMVLDASKFLLVYEYKG